MSVLDQMGKLASFDTIHESNLALKFFDLRFMLIDLILFRLHLLIKNARPNFLLVFDLRYFRRVTLDLVLKLLDFLHSFRRLLGIVHVILLTAIQFSTRRRSSLSGRELFEPRHFSILV